MSSSPRQLSLIIKIIASRGRQKLVSARSAITVTKRNETQISVTTVTVTGQNFMASCGTCLSHNRNWPSGLSPPLPGESLTDVTFSRLLRWRIVPIVRTADVEADVECYRLSTQ